MAVPFPIERPVRIGSHEPLWHGEVRMVLEPLRVRCVLLGEQIAGQRCKLPLAQLAPEVVGLLPVHDKRMRVQDLYVVDVAGKAAPLNDRNGIAPHLPCEPNILGGELSAVVPLDPGA